MDIERIRRQVVKIQSALHEAESKRTRASIQALHQALFVGVTVLEHETGQSLLPSSTARSGGSGKDRPDVSGE